MKAKGLRVGSRWRWEAEDGSRWTERVVLTLLDAAGAQWHLWKTQARGGVVEKGKDCIKPTLINSYWGWKEVSFENALDDIVNER